MNYYTEPIGEEKLRELIAKMGITPRELLRTREPLYKELGLDAREVSDDELIRLMVEHQDLMQRPIVERGERALLARPAERILEIL